MAILATPFSTNATQVIHSDARERECFARQDQEEKSHTSQANDESFHINFLLESMTSDTTEQHCRRSVEIDPLLPGAGEDLSHPCREKS